jgi:hypothetical protein
MVTQWRLYGPKLRLPEIPELLLKIPGICTEDKNVSPIVVKLRPGATPVSQEPYFIPFKTHVLIQKHLDTLLKYGLFNGASHPGTPPYYPSKNQGSRILSWFRTSGRRIPTHSYA